MFTGIHFEIENEEGDNQIETISLSDGDDSYHSGVPRPQIQMIDDHNLLNLTSVD